MQAHSPHPWDASVSLVDLHWESNYQCSLTRDGAWAWDALCETWMKSNYYIYTVVWPQGVETFSYQHRASLTKKSGLGFRYVNITTTVWWSWTNTFFAAFFAVSTDIRLHRYMQLVSKSITCSLFSLWCISCLVHSIMFAIKRSFPSLKNSVIDCWESKEPVKSWQFYRQLFDFL